ncbi:MAG: hypothetical protein WD403_12355 [Pirellulales bacterium]
MIPTDQPDDQAENPYRSPAPQAAPEPKPKPAIKCTPTVLVPFMVFAAIGLILSAIAHACAILGLPQPLGGATEALHVGIFVVGLPVVLVSSRLARGFKQKGSSRVILRGCPPWMRWMSGGLLIYFIGTFFFCVTSMIAAPPLQPAPNAPPLPVAVRLFSGGWMFFYFAAMATFYSAVVVAQRDPARRCPNGHPVSPGADLCEECGATITDSKFGDT